MTRVNGCGNPKCDASGCNCYNDKLLASALKRKDVIFESAFSLVVIFIRFLNEFLLNIILCFL